MKPISVSAAERIAKDYGYDQVYIIARSVGKDGGEHMTTYGINREHCDIASSTGATLQRLMGWSGEAIGSFIRRIVPAALRPGHYAGDQGDRTEDQWRADAIRAYVTPPERGR